MSFIDSSYFVGEISIPNATTEAALTQAIVQYEKEILIQLLGYSLYALLIADLDSSGDPATQIYTDLVDGVAFTHTYRGEDYSLRWEGLRNSQLQSLLAYYVFYRYVERDVTRLYGTGVSMASVKEGWLRASSVNKLCSAWERMRELYGIIPPEYKPVYPRPVLGTNLPSVFNADASAYNFLFTNKANYPTWIYTPQWNINAFGI